MRIHEALIQEVSLFYVKHHTTDGIFLVFYSPHDGNNSLEIEKRLGFQVSIDEDLDICMIKYETYEEALKAWHSILDLDIGAEIWVDGKKKKKAKI